MRRTQEEAAETRQKLLDAALKVFSQYGYAGAGLEAIAEAAGVTKGSIFHHFGSKAGLYSTLVAESSQRVLDILQRAKEEARRPMDILRSMLILPLRHAERDRDFRAVQELVLLKTAVVPELAEGIQRKIQGMRGFVDELAAIVQEGIDQDEIDETVDPRDAALALIALQTGLLSTWLLDPGLFSFRDRLETIADIYLRGIAAM